ncbi:hypothetical protein EXIGLDRAFT_835432 [Exidia glandulosa HHB12029]|uniref:Zn(2)-C6 fungal-type domain-containing protein n=1 Tax=Exidia glandulosa HHB12029 TaxID=1314781 RepID=A0A165IT62_EXIGL|nr:hypothetical protein EXIGLDRAFT_835432 [Exidia glandulosa HHB12029]
MPSHFSMDGQRSDQPSLARRHAPTSCAECRRLRLRCDKKVPCSTCVKRGCPNVCPDGTLPKGQVQGKRLVMTDTRQLYEKIESMRNRISKLEQAIADLRASRQDVPATRVHHSQSSDNQEVPVDDQLSDLFGTLTIGEHSSFFGPHAASRYFIFSKFDSDKCMRHKRDTFTNYPHFSGVSVGLWNGADDFLRILAHAMPPEDEARDLAAVYRDYLSWLLGVLTWEEIDSLLDLHYTQPEHQQSHIRAQEYAQIYMVFAHALLLQDNIKTHADAAIRFFNLATFALSYDDIFEHPTLQAIRCLHLMAWLWRVLEEHNTMTRVYALQGLAAQMCKSLGLHKDDSPWKLDDAEKQLRRRIAWNVVQHGFWIAVVLGRPPSFSSRFFDARLPLDTEAFCDLEGRWYPSSAALAHNFVSICMLSLVDQAFGTQGIAHSTALSLDAIVRDHVATLEVHLHLQVNSHCGPPRSPDSFIQHGFSNIVPQKLLFYIHRSFFAYAIEESPDDLLSSKYAGSVLATFRAALSIAVTTRTLYEGAPSSIRLLSFYTTIFSASVILASIVIRSPNCQLAPIAWTEFDAIFTMTESWDAASHFMPSLRKLRGKAIAARASREGRPKSPAPVDLDDVEQAFIYGRKRLVKATVSESAVESELPWNSSSEEGWRNSGVEEAGSSPVFAGQGLSFVPDGDDHHSVWTEFMNQLLDK